MRSSSIVRKSISRRRRARNRNGRGKVDSGRRFYVNARPLAALEVKSREIAQDGSVSVREGTNEEMPEKAQHEEKRRQAAALQSAPAVNSWVGRGADEEFLHWLAGSK